MMHVTFEDDEFLKRKFDTKEFSINVDKMSDKDIEECKKKYKSSPRRNISNGISHSRSPTPNSKETYARLSRRNNSTPNRSENRKDLDGSCSDPEEEFYKEKFCLQECEIALPRVPKNNTNKRRKLAFIFDYLTFNFLLKICVSIVVVIPLVLYFL